MARVPDSGNVFDVQCGPAMHGADIRHAQRLHIRVQFDTLPRHQPNDRKQPTQHHHAKDELLEQRRSAEE